MAVKKCPHCGRKIAMNARFCVFCHRKFDDLSQDADTTNAETENNEVVTEQKDLPKSKHISVMVLFISVIAIVAVVVGGVLLRVNRPTPDNESNGVQDTVVTTVKTTQPTRDPSRDAFLQRYVGYWVDESSVGKGDIVKQGGMELNILSIQDDTVTLNLTSYLGGDTDVKAFLNELTVVANEEYMMLFSFEDDGLGHSGEGCLRFRDDMIDLEIVLNDETDSASEEHSLKMNTVFKRLSLPQAEGIDITSLVTLDTVKSMCGDPTGEVQLDEASGLSTCSFGQLTVKVDANGTVKQIFVDYSLSEDKAMYRYDRVDGTMNYETIKTYFGEAEHDYTEQPTDIRVLRYVRSDQTKTAFVFDAQNDCLLSIQHIF